MDPFFFLVHSVFIFYLRWTKLYRLVIFIISRDSSINFYGNNCGRRSGVPTSLRCFLLTNSRSGRCTSDSL